MYRKRTVNTDAALYTDEQAAAKKKKLTVVIADTDKMRLSARQRDQAKQMYRMWKRPKNDTNWYFVTATFEGPISWTGGERVDCLANLKEDTTSVNSIVGRTLHIAYVEVKYDLRIVQTDSIPTANASAFSVELALYQYFSASVTVENNSFKGTVNEPAQLNNLSAPHNSASVTVTGTFKTVSMLRDDLEVNTNPIRRGKFKRFNSVQQVNGREYSYFRPVAIDTTDPSKTVKNGIWLQALSDKNATTERYTPTLYCYVNIMYAVK